MRPLNSIATEVSVFNVAASNYLFVDSFISKKWNSSESLPRNENEVHFVVHYCHLLVFVIPMSTYHKTIFIITKNVVGMTFIINVMMSRPNGMWIWYAAGVFIPVILPEQ